MHVFAVKWLKYERGFILRRRGIIMSNTSNSLENIQEKQAKDEQNRKRQGKGNPGQKLPNKQH
jgi:hypothetical protein